MIKWIYKNLIKLNSPHNGTSLRVILSHWKEPTACEFDNFVD